MPDKIKEIPPEQWKKWCEAYVASCKRLELRVTELTTYVQMYEREKAQWADERSNQQEVMQKVLNDHNSRMNVILGENESLKARVRELENGDQR